MYNFKTEENGTSYDVQYEGTGGDQQMEFKVLVNNQDKFDFIVTAYKQSTQTMQIENGKNTELFEKIMSKVVADYRSQQSSSSGKG